LDSTVHEQRFRLVGGAGIKPHQPLLMRSDSPHSGISKSYALGLRRPSAARPDALDGAFSNRVEEWAGDHFEGSTDRSRTLGCGVSLPVEISEDRISIRHGRERANPTGDGSDGRQDRKSEHLNDECDQVPADVIAE
jgi:hypothetical protein